MDSTAKPFFAIRYRSDREAGTALGSPLWQPRGAPLSLATRPARPGAEVADIFRRESRAGAMRLRPAKAPSSVRHRVPRLGVGLRLVVPWGRTARPYPASAPAASLCLGRARHPSHQMVIHGWEVTLGGHYSNSRSTTCPVRSRHDGPARRRAVRPPLPRRIGTAPVRSVGPVLAVLETASRHRGRVPVS